MSKKEYDPTRYYPKMPSPTPAHLENSIEALEAQNPHDLRIDKRKAQMNRAKTELKKWEEKVSRVKKALKRK